LTDFDEIWQGDAHEIERYNFEFLKSKMVEQKQKPTTEGEAEVLVYKIKSTSRS